MTAWPRRILLALLGVVAMCILMSTLAQLALE